MQTTSLTNLDACDVQELDARTAEQTRGGFLGAILLGILCAVAYDIADNPGDFWQGAQDARG
jgi:hypothetical protein